MSEKTSFTGRTLEIAIAAAAKAYGVTPEELDYDVLAGQGGGFALIKVKGQGGAAAAPAMVEKLSGTGAPEGSDEGEDHEHRAESRGGRDRDRGGRGRDRGGRDRDRGGRDRDRGGRGRDRRGRRDDDRGRSRRGGRGRSYELLEVPADGPTEVTMIVPEGVELSEIGEDAHEVMRDILTGMGFGMKVTLHETEDAIRFDLESGPYHGALVANEMEVLDAIEHLVDKIVNFDGDHRKRITVDSEGAKAGAEDELSESARALAEKALADGQTYKMGPMNARSRRIVHMTLRDVDGVTTRSEGEGAFRRVCIVPNKG